MNDEAQRSRLRANDAITMAAAICSYFSFGFLIFLWREGVFLLVRVLATDRMAETTPAIIRWQRRRRSSRAV